PSPKPFRASQATEHGCVVDRAGLPPGPARFLLCAPVRVCVLSGAVGGGPPEFRAAGPVTRPAGVPSVAGAGAERALIHVGPVTERSAARGSPGGAIAHIKSTRCRAGVSAALPKTHAVTPVTYRPAC